MVVQEWVERPVIVEYISGPAFDYSDPPKIVQGPISARTGRFILKAYDERGVRIARFPTDPGIYPAEAPAAIPTDPCVYIAWNALLVIRPLSQEAFAEQSYAEQS